MNNNFNNCYHFPKNSYFNVNGFLCVYMSSLYYLTPNQFMVDSGWTSFRGYTLKAFYIFFVTLYSLPKVALLYLKVIGSNCQMTLKTENVLPKTISGNNSIISSDASGDILECLG